MDAIGAPMLAAALAGALADPTVARLAERLPHALWLDCGGERLAVARGPDAGDAAPTKSVSTVSVGNGAGSAPGAKASDTQPAEAGPSPAPAEVVASAPAAVWAAMLGALPAPGLQSAGAAMRSGCGFALEGEPLAVAQSLPLVELLIERLRAVANAAVEPPAPEHALGSIRPRYRRIGWPAGDACWVFEEEAGDASQPVMLLLHTAGADSRQWHGLMSDPLLARDWRLVAFDMPMHGRSRAPQGWRGEPWSLDTERYLDCITAWMDAAGVQRAAIAGCSMGAAAGLAFLARRPERALGAILLEAPWRSPGRRSPYLDHPAVHGGRIAPAWVQALLSPASPAAERRLATWIYSQGAPGVYEGDLAFYSDEFDAADHVGAIDTAATPLWLLTGEYDYSATPADSRRVADAVPGAQFREMPRLGHFPMTEHPAALLEHFAPAARALREHVSRRATTGR